MCILQNPELIIALCALITSVVSIIVAVFTLRLRKKHYLKSVKPIGDIVCGDYENDIYIAICNNGIGPLLIKRLIVSSSECFDENIVAIIPENIKQALTPHWTDFFYGVKNRAILPKERIYLFRLSFNEKSEIIKHQTHIADFRKFLAGLTIELTYTDIYEKQTYRIEKKELSMFKPDLRDKYLTATTMR